MWSLHTIAILLIGLLFIVGYALNRLTIGDNALDERTINSSGLQRTFSVRILYIGERHYWLGDSSSAEGLMSAIADFEQGNARLVSFALENPQLRALYMSADGANLDVRSRAFVEKAKQLLDYPPFNPQARRILNQLALEVEDGLLANLNDVVLLVEQTVAENKANFLRLQNVLLLVGLAFLAAAVLVFIRPANRAVYRTLMRLDRAANYDTLTDLPNRKKMWDVLDGVLAEDQTNGAGLAVIAIDLDGFKRINDTLGHPAGDAVLVHVARLLEIGVAEMETNAVPLVARLGGDEFVIVLALEPEAAAERVEVLGEALLEAVREPFAIRLSDSEENCLIGMSLGYAFASDSDQDRDLLVANADIALYLSKRNGKNRMTRFTHEMRTNAERRHRTETDLRQAVLKSEFVPFYQPQVSLTDGSLSGFEVLMRWKHPERGLLAPEDFMQVAEQTGLLDMIEGSVMLQALEDFGTIRDMGHHIPRISINASAQTLRKPEFAKNLRSICAMYEIAPASVAVEVLETVLVENPEDQAVKTIFALAKAGHGTVIDDFGTGYSSLSMVSQLEIDSLKLDRSLIALAANDRTQKVLKAAIAMSHSMGLDIVAEGIETAEQYETLKNMGCDKGQGYAIGPAFNLQDTIAWLTMHADPVPVDRIA